eukprot:1763776-Pleurochrysis_carterae.AAC.1
MSARQRSCSSSGAPAVAVGPDSASTAAAGCGPSRPRPDAPPAAPAQAVASASVRHHALVRICSHSASTVSALQLCARAVGDLSSDLESPPVPAAHGVAGGGLGVG